MASNPLDDGMGALSPALSPESVTERREHARHLVRVRVLVAVGQTVLPGRTDNLSPGGACVFLDEKLPEGATIPVRFLTPYLDQFKFIDVTAKVQYSILTSGSPAYRTGVQFVGTNAEARRRLAMLIGG